MNYTALLDTIRTFADRQNRENREDAFVNAVLPEISKYFIALFKERDEESVINEINRFVLMAYQMMPNVAQFLIRLMAGLQAEKMQGRFPPWISLPVVVFVQGYFNALEETATKNKDEPPTLEDLEMAGHKVAASIRNATSDLRTKFDAAKVAAASVTLPFTDSDGGHMPDTEETPTTPGARTPQRPVSSAGTNGPSFMDRLSDFLDGFFAPTANMVRMAAFIGNRGEDIVQNVASAVFWVFILFLFSVISVSIAFLRDVSAMGMAIIIILLSALWVVGPLTGYIILRRRARKAAERTLALENNPNERAGNGFLEGGGLVLTLATEGGIAMPMIAFLCTVGVYHSFAWEYLVMGLVAIALGSFSWSFSDLWFDTVKAFIRAGTPDDKEGIELKLKNRLAWSFSHVGIVYCTIMTPAMFAGVMEHTKYSWVGASFPALFLALFMRFVDIYTNTAPDAQPVKRSRWGWAMALLSMMAPGLLFYSVNTFIPPECKDTDNDPETAQVCPSYTSRLKDWYATPAGSGTSSGAAEVEASGVPNSCSDEVKDLVERAEKNDCKVILEQGHDQRLISLCEEAVNCGALLSNGSKKRTVVFRAVTPHDSGIGGWLSGWTVIGALVVLVVVLAIIGFMNPPGEKKKGAH